MGKKFNEAKLLAVAKRYRPAGVRIKYRRDDKLGPAHAIIYTNGVKEIYVPYPVTREALFYFLHECAHFILGHMKTKIPVWKMEYEAEQWTIATMRREGIPVPKRSIRDAKTYIHNLAVAHIEMCRPRPPQRILDWCGINSSVDA